MITLPDELSERLRATAAKDSVSQFVTDAVEVRLDREMWLQAKHADKLLGVDEVWMRQQVQQPN